MNLPPYIVVELTDILANYPENILYDILKSAMLKRVGKTDESRLLNNVHLRKKDPLELLRQMKSSIGSNVMTGNTRKTIARQATLQFYLNFGAIIWWHRHK